MSAATNPAPTDPQGSPPHPGISWASFASLVLGLLTLAGGAALTGIPALVLGLRGLRTVHAAEGRLRGRRLAIAGMALGGVGTVLTTCGLFALLTLHYHSRSQRAGCQNNLRLVGIAAAKYQNLHEHFPAAAIPNPDLPPPQRLSWLVALLPYLDENPNAGTPWADLAAEIDTDRAWDAHENATAVSTYVPLFLCPADRRDEVRASSLTSYVGISGVGARAVSLPRSDLAAGVFGYDRGITPDEARRGTSVTMMATETVWHLGPWAAAGPATVRGVPEEGPAIRCVEGRNDLMTESDRPFGSFHPAGIHVLWLDGSVRIVRPDIDPPAFRILALLHEPR